MYHMFGCLPLRPDSTAYADHKAKYDIPAISLTAAIATLHDSVRLRLRQKRLCAPAREHVNGLFARCASKQQDFLSGIIALYPLCFMAGHQALARPPAPLRSHLQRASESPFLKASPLLHESRSLRCSPSPKRRRVGPQAAALGLETPPAVLPYAPIFSCS